MTDPTEQEETTPKPEIGRSRELAVMALLLLLTAAVRAFIVWRTDCVSKDSTAFLNMAQYLRDRDFATFFESAQHHLFPLVLFMVQEVIGTSLFAAHVFNIVLGTVTLIPFYLLARDVFGVKSAMAASLFFAFHVVIARSAAAVATEPLYLLTFLSALYMGKRAIDTGEMLRFVLAGFLLGLAFMARVEGIGLWMILGGWAALLGVLKSVSRLILRREYDPSGPRLLAGLVVMTLAACVTIVPHLLEVRFAEDWNPTWRLSRKHSIGEFARGEQVLSPSAPAPAAPQAGGGRMEHLASCLEELSKEGLWAYHLPSTLALFYLLGVICRRSHRREMLGELILASVALAYLAAAFLLVKVHGRLSERHFISSAAVALMWAGPGFLAARDLIARLIARWDKLERSPARVTAVVLMIVTLASMSAKTLRAIGWKKVYLRELGLQLREEYPPEPGKRTRVMASGLPRIIFYGEGQWLSMRVPLGKTKRAPEDAFKMIVDYGRKKRAALLMLCPEEFGGYDAELQSLLAKKGIGPAFTLQCKRGKVKGTLCFYRYQDLPPRPPGGDAKAT